jgi:hypothetical protein
MIRMHKEKAKCTTWEMSRINNVLDAQIMVALGLLDITILMNYKEIKIDALNGGNEMINGAMHH